MIVKGCFGLKFGLKFKVENGEGVQRGLGVGQRCERREEGGQQKGTRCRVPRSGALEPLLFAAAGTQRQPALAGASGGLLDGRSHAHCIVKSRQLAAGACGAHPWAEVEVQAALKLLLDEVRVHGDLSIGGKEGKELRRLEGAKVGGFADAAEENTGKGMGRMCREGSAWRRAAGVGSDVISTAPPAGQPRPRPAGAGGVAWRGSIREQRARTAAPRFLVAHTYFRFSPHLSEAAVALRHKLGALLLVQQLPGGALLLFSNLGLGKVGG